MDLAIAVVHIVAAHVLVDSRGAVETILSLQSVLHLLWWRFVLIISSNVVHPVHWNDLCRNTITFRIQL